MKIIFILIIIGIIFLTGNYESLSILYQFYLRLSTIFLLIIISMCLGANFRSGIRNLIVEFILYSIVLFLFLYVEFNDTYNILNKNNKIDILEYNKRFYGGSYLYDEYISGKYKNTLIDRYKLFEFMINLTEINNNQDKIGIPREKIRKYKVYKILQDDDATILININHKGCPPKLNYDNLVLGEFQENYNPYNFMLTKESNITIILLSKGDYSMNLITCGENKNCKALQSDSVIKINYNILSLIPGNVMASITRKYIKLSNIYPFHEYSIVISENKSDRWCLDYQLWILIQSESKNKHFQFRN